LLAYTGSLLNGSRTAGSLKSFIIVGGKTRTLLDAAKQIFK